MHKKNHHKKKWKNQYICTQQFKWQYLTTKIFTYIVSNDTIRKTKYIMQCTGKQLEAAAASATVRVDSFLNVTVERWEDWQEALDSSQETDCISWLKYTSEGGMLITSDNLMPEEVPSFHFGKRIFI